MITFSFPLMKKGKLTFSLPLMKEGKRKRACMKERLPLSPPVILIRTRNKNKDLSCINTNDRLYIYR